MLFRKLTSLPNAESENKWISISNLTSLVNLDDIMTKNQNYAKCKDIEEGYIYFLISVLPFHEIKQT